MPIGAADSRVGRRLLDADGAGLSVCVLGSCERSHFELILLRNGLILVAKLLGMNSSELGKFRIDPSVMVFKNEGP